ncbi:MAG: hypothetical protein Kow0080_16470 [Candidatus Promineifilaceae bacterium]
MNRPKQLQWTGWGVVVLFLLTAVLLVWFGPEERTLGDGIKSVYVHVGLIWTGLAGFGVAALLGAVVAFGKRESLFAWLLTASRVGLLFYFAGFAASTVSSKINWGAVFWQEPRMATAVNMLTVAIIVQVLTMLLPQKRLVGALHTLYFIVLLWANASTRLVLHPDNPIGSSNATGIRFTFLAVFVLIAGAAAWGAYLWQRRTVEK